MKKYLIFIAFILAATAISASGATDTAELDVKSTPSSCELYGKIEISATLKGYFKNPFDYDTVSVSAYISTPEGKKFSLPGFYTGRNGEWKILYTPLSPGKHKYYISVLTQSGEKHSQTFELQVSPSDKNGFLRKSGNNVYLRFDSGKPFFGIGHNVAWVADNNISQFEKYFIDMKNNGCNMTRVWINLPWTINIEDKTMGRYNISESEKLDKLLQLAEKHGIYVVLVLDSYSSVMNKIGQWGENCWDKNPYNRANGGPCAAPDDFFTNSTAIKFYKNRLKYIIARWASSPAIAAFELCNEADFPTAWIQDMLNYMKQTNPYGQLTTLSLSMTSKNLREENIIPFVGIDIVQPHLYGNQSSDPIGSIIYDSRDLINLYKKPLFIGEFGIDSTKNDRICDPNGTGIALHNSIWATALSGNCATAMNWWWAGYIRGRALYGQYLPLSLFLKETDWNNRSFCFPELSPIYQTSSTASYNNTAVPTAKTWGETRYKKFTILNNGDIRGGHLNYYLHGSSKKDIKINPVFVTNFPTDGKFRVCIDMVSQGGDLEIILDGAKVHRSTYPTGPGNGPWQRSSYMKDLKIYQCFYNTSVEIPVTKGEHTIELRNNGLDWIGIKRIELENYISTDFANARLTGVTLGDTTLLWIQNKDYDLSKISSGKFPEFITKAYFDILNISDGHYQIEWWNTTLGEISQKKTEISTNSKIRVV
ncbi:MAG TPA: DUF5060 domain-containing protein, partial [Candidatus Omnitrophota bacterium]|nr:DUF5060 domain-containing protein [Candidatus Omnitrophota bacterium]